MKPYPKIQTVFERDPANKFKTLLEGHWACKEFRYLQDAEWTWMEKVDGTNIRVMWNGLGTIHLAGKTDSTSLYAPLVEHLYQMFPSDALLSTFGSEPGEVCFYGEGYGRKIHGGGRYKPEGVDFVLFDIKIGPWWLQRKDLIDIALELGLRFAPVVGIGNLKEMVTQASVGFTSAWGDFPAEGIVARPTVELTDRAGHRIITKVKHKDFKV